MANGATGSIRAETNSFIQVIWGLPARRLFRGSVWFTRLRTGQNGCQHFHTRTGTRVAVLTYTFKETVSRRYVYSPPWILPWHHIWPCCHNRPEVLVRPIILLGYDSRRAQSRRSGLPSFMFASHKQAALKKMYIESSNPLSQPERREFRCG